MGKCKVGREGVKQTGEFSHGRWGRHWLTGSPKIIRKALDRWGNFEAEDGKAWEEGGTKMSSGSCRVGREGVGLAGKLHCLLGLTMAGDGLSLSM